MPELWGAKILVHGNRWGQPPFIPSCVSGRGYKIGPVCVCVCVCLSVCQRSHGWTVWDTNLKFSVNIAFGNISDEFEGQGHRSKVMGAILKNVIFGCSYGLTCVYCTKPFSYDIRCHVTSRRDNLTSFDNIWARILTKRAHHGRARQRSGVFIWFLFLSISHLISTLALLSLLACYRALLDSFRPFQTFLAQKGWGCQNYGGAKILVHGNGQGQPPHLQIMTAPYIARLSLYLIMGRGNFCKVHQL